MTQRNNNPGRILKGTAIQPTLKSASGVWTINEALQAHRNNSWPQPNLFQPISNSVRNSYAKTAYLTITPSRSGSNRRFTMSWWFKLGQLAVSGGTQRHFFYSYDGSNLFQIFLERASGTNPDYICIYGGGADVRFTLALRDTGAWYHLVISVDLNQSSTNIIKGWMNGVQMTVAGSQSTGTPSYPTGTTYWPVFQTNAYQRIGGNAGGGTFDGYFTEINFIDGQALQPTMFGQFDSNNAWVPIPYTGSYGTNGFYLPFTNTQTSQTLGYDASLNGTPTYTADQDPYRGSVTLHLDGNGPVGAQNNTFIDSSINNLAITRQGTPTQGSFSPFSFPGNAPYNPAVNGGSMYTSSSLNANNYLTTAATSALEFGSGNFTIELWWYPQSTTRQALYHGSAGADWSVGIDFNGTGVQSIGIWASSNGTSWNLLSGDPSGNGVGSVIITQNAWNHIVYQRNGTTWQSFINGQLDRNVTGLSGTIPSRSSNGKNIGAWWNTTAMSTATGYISNFRIITGQAVYAGSSGFTPMTKPFGTLTNNLVAFSEDFGNSTWSNYQAVITPGAGIAIDGTPSATFISPSVTGTTYSFINYNITASYVNTFSVYAKAGTYPRIGISDRSSTSFGAIFDLTTASLVNTYSGSATITGTAITSVGNGWYRISVTTTSSVQYNIHPLPATSSNAQTLSLGNAEILTTGLGIYIWGAQWEAGSVASSYTPTPANYLTAPALLLNFANAAIVDSAGGNNVITVNSATISAVSKYGSGALSFNGVTDYLLVPPNNSMAFGTGAFTIEFWHFSPTIGSNTCLIDMQNGLMIRQNSNNSLLTYSRATGTQLIVTPNNTLMPNVWSHVAVTRLGTTMTAWINGQNQGQWSLNDSLTQTANTYIGAFINNQVAPQTFTGQLDDLRITAGVARYQANFTPPVRALPAIGGKSFVTQNINAGVVKSFTTTGTTSWTAPSDVTQVEVLVVAGGGGGCIGGGGAGGLIYNSQYSVTPGQTYTVTVGAGGTAATNNSSGAGSGGNSIFGNLIAIGGGFGGGDTTGLLANGYAGIGGSGGGGGFYSGTASGSTQYIGAAGTAGQGFAGGNGLYNGTPNYGGGGGGAGGAGSTNPGNGGNGLQFGISGTPTYYAGGGGGSERSQTAPGTGGLGGGGNGAASGGTATSGTANTGGGGGAAQGNASTNGTGGSGIVVVRYTTNTVGNTSDTTTDTVTDSPTLYGHDFGLGGEVVGNYNTLNPLWSNQVNYLNGNLTVTPVTGNAGYCHFISSIAMPSTGYWYAEFTINTLPYPSGNNNMLGIVLANATANAPPIGTYFGYNSTEYSYLDAGGFRTNNTTSQTASAWAANDVIMIALGNGNVWFGRNGVWQGSGSPNPATATSPAYTGLNGNYQFAGNTYGGGYGGQISANFGQRAWQYTPPAGYQALTLKNFQRPTITPNQHFAANTWTQGTTDVTIVNTGGFQPDLVWIKARNNAQNHYLIDSVRGATSLLRSNAATAESTGSTWVTFNSNGFVPSSANTVTNTYTYVAWQWKAGGTAVTNNVGTISAQVSANTTSGFSIITYTGNGATTATVGHGLNATPSFVLYKGRTAAAGDQNWVAMHTSLGTGNYIYLNSTNASTAFSTAFPWTSTTISANTTFNTSGATYVAYCWAETPGFSKFGTYAGNSSTDGPFIYCGFTPAMVIIKGTFSAAASQWYVYDNGRDPAANPLLNRLLLNTTDADTNGTSTDIDFVSNGFKLRYPAGGGGLNSTGSNYIYMAFAASPFGNTNGTAR